MENLVEANASNMQDSIAAFKPDEDSNEPVDMKKETPGKIGRNQMTPTPNDPQDMEKQKTLGEGDDEKREKFSIAES